MYVSSFFLRGLDLGLFHQNLNRQILAKRSDSFSINYRLIQNRSLRAAPLPRAQRPRLKVERQQLAAFGWNCPDNEGGLINENAKDFE
jgi:hypothetical protein